MDNSEIWGSSHLNYRNPDIGQSVGSNSSTPLYNTSSMLSTPMGRVFTSPPAVPARPVRNMFSNSYNSYSSPFSNTYSYGGYAPAFSTYGGYGNYGFGNYRTSFGSYGYGYSGNSYPENRFIQLAEESSRPAFQSIQSFLHAFNSIAMMFDSSFHAIYSSYMSVLGVADNFGKLRTLFGKVFSTFAIIRTLNWIFRKLLYMLGINKEDFTKELVWSDALNGASDVNTTDRKNNRKTWPMLLFWSILIGGPYLMFKLISELNPTTIQDIWVPAEHSGFLAVGLYNFHGASDQELSFIAQQKLMIAPKEFQPLDCPGWLLACNESRKIGLVPNNYIGIIMQSEKTGETFIEHNGQKYQNFTKGLEKTTNSVENVQKSANASEKFNGELPKINEESETE